MIAALEKFLFEKFNQMPLSIRIFTYVFVLFLFAYLLLVPRFINGELVYKFEHGGTVPYRGGDIQMFVEGRMLKFKANEDGYWSVPIVSRLPRSIRVKFHHIDEDAWFSVNFDAKDYWLKDVFQITVTDNPPNVTVAAKSNGNNIFSKIYAGFNGMSFVRPDIAEAGQLQLPQNLESDEINMHEQEHVKSEVIETISKFTGKEPSEITPDFYLTSDSNLSYAKRIGIIIDLERKFGLKIPDEHWHYLNTVVELVNYIYGRKIVDKSQKYDPWAIEQAKTPQMIQQDTQESIYAVEQIPFQNRPRFKR